ncbi:unnamed protein product [Rhizophagus irregularis]|nr:unnamed protein product [Rhizophagus irregularis]
MGSDIESGNYTYIDYVAISPDGSMVAKFSPRNDNYSIVIKKVTTSAIISFHEKNWFETSIPKNLLGWSLAVSDIIDNGNDIGLVAISCITNNDIFKVDKQFLSSWSSSEGMTKLYEFSFRNNRITPMRRDYRLGGIVSFLKNSERSSNIATLICMNYMKIQKLNIKLNGKSEECSYMLPRKLFKELENVKDAEKNWKYLLKSRYQEFLMTDTSDNEQMQYIEIYNINTSKLMNVFHRHHGEDDFLISRNNEPGIFAVSTDSRLFAYSYGDNVIVLYLMESGLEIVSKRFDSVCKIKFLEFIEKDKKLFIIEKDKDGSVKFHIWLILGCLNDYFPNISKDNITLSETPLSENDISTLLNCSEYYHILTKANGTITTIGESDRVTDEHEYNSHDLEPWNQNNSKRVIGKFLNNDKSALLITGQNSIQVWKPKSKNFKNLNDFKNFENSNLVYILIIERNPPKFQINDDMTTIITHACKSLTYLYMHTKDITSKKRNQKFVSGTINIIKDFIKKYPDNWKLMEVQYPLMAYLIYSRSFSLIKYILFDNNDPQEKSAKKLHRPQSRYGSYPYYNDLESYLKLYVDSDFCLKSANNLELSLLICKSRDSRRNNYLNSLYYKPCFGEMKYNFSSNIFQTLANKDTLKVYVPLTRLIPINSFNIFNYATISDDILSDIYMVPLPNFTTYDPKIKAKTGILLLSRLFSIMAINIFIFGNILKIIIPFFGFMLILTIGFGHSMFVLFGHPSFTNLNPSNPTFTLKNGNETENLTLTETNPDNPFDTMWNAILSTYYWSTLNLNVYEYWPLKLLFFLAHVTLVLVLLNMIIALMNGEFNKAKEDGKLGLLMYREELINDYERLDDPFSNQLYNDSPYICFLRDSDLMKKWISKSQELKKTKLYSWFSESTGVDEEKITFSDDDENIKSWYKAFISSNEN